MDTVAVSTPAPPPEPAAAPDLGQSSSDAERGPEQQGYLSQLAEIWPVVRQLETLARESVRLFREHDMPAPGRW